MAERIAFLLQKYISKFNRFKRSKHFTFGIPFLIFVVGGSFALKEFAKVRYEFSHVNPFDLPSSEYKGVAIDPEKEYESMMAQANAGVWENKRIPRPWEEEKTSS